MTEPTRYSTPPIDLPLDPWLLEGTPVNGCKICMALARERKAALSRKDMTKAYETSREIRNHRHD
ncbi:hypothetical protein [Streptomyces sp. NPDC018000]|uniref:hypothetical protein n=1 Tax=Streptomyces sp. NPDC018000 TaxID=3365028 RepID=UPI0037A57D37